jgi:hypothetical protein
MAKKGKVIKCDRTLKQLWKSANFHISIYPQMLALTSLTSRGRSQTQAMEFVFLYIFSKTKFYFQVNTQTENCTTGQVSVETTEFMYILLY